MALRLKHCALFVGIIFAMGASSAQGAAASEVRAITEVTPLAETVGRYEKFELVVGLDADFENPYDPDDIRLDATFTSPSSETVTVPGFYYREFILADSGTIAPTQEWSWRVRFTPWETGEWSYTVTASTVSGEATSEAQTFTVTESDNPGFIRVDPRNPRYFAFDDGTPYFAIGENIGWAVGGQPIADYRAWLDGLSGAGGNFIRVWMASWGFGIEWNDTGLGNYDRRQNRAFQLDQVFNLAAERDVYIMLSLLNHGAFNLTVDAEWDGNPYNAANGGPLEQPAEFGTNPEAIKFWHQRLRYIAARWGYSPNLMTWEWWNEVNWTPLVNADILAPWIEQSAAYLSALDPYDHLMTHSGSPVTDEAVWGQPSMDFVQEHRYNMTSLLRTFGQTVDEYEEAYPDKPFLMGEFGSPSELDLDGVMLHLGLWSAPMEGAAGTGMTWWWDNYIHPNNLYFVFEPVAKFFGSEDLGARQWSETTAELIGPDDARIYGLQAEDAALIWVVSRNFDETRFMRAYERNLRNRVENPLDITYPPVEGVSIMTTGLAPGAYQVEIWDSYTGEMLESLTVEADDGAVTVPLPTFDKDLALKIKPG